jgi:hypothetical protein
MAAMADQALAFSHGLMHTADLRLVLTLIMTISANFGWFIVKHTGIFTGMLGVAGLAITFLNRFVLCRSRDIVMTGKAESVVDRAKTDHVTLDLVTVIAVATSHRRVDHFPEQPGIGGTVLGMTIDASGRNRVVLVGRVEP